MVAEQCHGENFEHEAGSVDDDEEVEDLGDCRQQDRVMMDQGGVAAEEARDEVQSKADGSEYISEGAEGEHLEEKDAEDDENNDYYPEDDKDSDFRL